MRLALFVIAAALASGAATAPRPAAAKKTVTHGGVSLTYDGALAAEVRASTAPAAPLASASDKPDWVWPEHTLFTFHGSAGEGVADEHRHPSVRVCPVGEYRRAFAVSARLVREADAAFRELRALLRRRPRSLDRDVPTLPFPDATDAFRARVKYLRLARGSGVAYLTQSQQDESIINNEQLTYEFRGLTDDGRFYVYASFPVAAPGLPAARDARTHEGYTLPDNINRRAYGAYVRRVKARLERLPPDDFNPSLRLLDEALSSLRIN